MDYTKMFIKQSPTTTMISKKTKSSIDKFAGDKKALHKCITVAVTHITIAEGDIIWSDSRAHQLITLGTILDIEYTFDLLLSLCKSEGDEDHVRKTRDYYIGKFTALRDRLESELFNPRSLQHPE